MSTRWAVSRATSRALVAAAAFVATMLPLPSAAASGAAAAPSQSACGGRLQVPDGVDNPELNGSVPVVLVHGISSSADLWDTDAADGGPNLAQTVADMDQASVWAFDYGDAALDWVTDPRIGPALADAVRCLHEQSGNHVVLVGHSMGGLAIQHAVAHGGLEQAVAHVSTIATPFEGSMSLTMVNRFLDPDAPGPLPASWRLIARVLLDKCAQLNQAAAAGDLWAICGPAGIPNSPVGRALMVGSEEIGALPPWPASVPTFRVAGSMELRPLLTPRPSYNVGDVAVALESALAPRVVDSVPATVIECQANVATFLTRRCFHSNLPHDREVIDAIAAQVEPVVDQAGGDVWTGTTHAVVSRSTHLVRAGYAMDGEFSFTVDDRGRIEGHAVVEYQPFFDAGGMNAALDYVEDAGSEIVGTLIPFPIDAGALLGLHDLQAVRGEYDEPVAVMEGPITGELVDDSMPMASIRWDGVEQIELPVTVFIDGVDGSAEIAREALLTDSPWPESARVEEPGGLRHAVSVTGDRSTDGGVTVASSTTWSAHPAG